MNNKEKELKFIIKALEHIANNGDGSSIQLSNISCKYLLEKIEKLEDEKQKLEKIIIEQDEEQRKLFNHIAKDDYKSRIDKAIEFIKENADYCDSGTFCSDLRYDECLELLSILRGEDKDDNR